MKALIAGYGSIGRRHARILAPLVDALAVVSSQPVQEHPSFTSLEVAVREFTPDMIVLCSITSAHADQLNTLRRIEFGGQVLAEKPLFASAAQDNAPYPFPLHVAYHLRFHPVIGKLREQLKAPALSAHVYVGQHLSQWRPGRDIKSTYSARRDRGGGVLRDLSHELDLISHLFGPIEASHAIGGRVGNVTVDSEDAVALVLKCKRCPVVSLQMNYLDHVLRREWIVNLPQTSLKADLAACTLAEGTNVSSIACGPDDAYRHMHKALLNGQADALCSYEEGLRIVRLIDDVDKAIAG